MMESRNNIETHVQTLPPDKELYPRLMARDHEGWMLFVAYHTGRLHRYFERRNVRTAEDRDDAAQETLDIFFQTLSSGKYNPEQGSLSQWLYGIARTVLSKHRTLYANEYSKEDELTDQPSKSEEESVTSLSNHDINRVQEAWSKLSNDEREVFTVRMRSDVWTWESIAQELNISVSAAKMRYQRARGKLERLLS